MLVSELREDGDRTTGRTTVCYRDPEQLIPNKAVDRDTILGGISHVIGDRLTVCNGLRKVRLLALDDAKDLVAEVLRGSLLAVRWGGHADGWSVRHPTTTMVMAAWVDGGLRLRVVEAPWYRA